MNKKLGYRIPVCCANGSRCHCLSLHTNARSRGLAVRKMGSPKEGMANQR
jgi:hypothetical protein